MSFNAGKYEATSTNEDKTNWTVKSFDGKEAFTLTDMKVGTVANKLMALTREAFLKKA